MILDRSNRDYTLRIRGDRMVLTRILRLRESFWDPNREVIYSGPKDSAPNFVKHVAAALLATTPSPTDSLESEPKTWLDIIAIEPRLLDLEKRSLDADRHDDWEWSRIKHAISRLVGWEAEQPSLRSGAAYDLAYDHLRRVFEQC